MAICKDCFHYAICRNQPYMSDKELNAPNAENDCDDFENKEDHVYDGPPHWVIQPKGYIPYRCSNCGCESMRASRYCPDCGKELKPKI